MTHKDYDKALMEFSELRTQFAMEHWRRCVKYTAYAIKMFVRIKA